MSLIITSKSRLTAWQSQIAAFRLMTQTSTYSTVTHGLMIYQGNKIRLKRIVIINKNQMMSSRIKNKIKEILRCTQYITLAGVAAN